MHMKFQITLKMVTNANITLTIGAEEPFWELDRVLMEELTLIQKDT